MNFERAKIGRTKVLFMALQRRFIQILVLPAVVGGLAGCDQTPPRNERPPTPVLAQVAEQSSRSTSVSLTGEVRARVQSDLSFRFSGRIAERKVDVGDHVEAGQVLATLETSEQTADVSSAQAGLQSAEATLKQETVAFERQKALIASGFTTKSSYDNAKQALDAAEAALEGAKATLGTAQDMLANTTLRAEAAGVITARNVEAGQVVDAAQAVFTLAQDGERDAVFDIYEALLAREPANKNIEIILLSDPNVKAVGTVREVAPSIDSSTGTIRVKVAIDNPPPQMGLGAAVVGIGRFQPQKVVVLPWTAFFEDKNKPAVWVVDPKTMIASLKQVGVESFRTGEVLVSDGLEQNDIVVTGGVQLLRRGETVAPQMTPVAGEAGGKP